MSALFGGKKSNEKTVLILDIENGSVGAALARLSPRSQPKLFGQMRTRLPLFSTFTAAGLEEEIHKASRQSIEHMKEVAARMHVYGAAANMVDRTAVFLHAPWSAIHFEESGKASVAAVEKFIDSMRGMHRAMFDSVPTTFHSFGAVVSPLLSSLFKIKDTTLVCLINGETAELIVVGGGTVRGYGSIPMGTRMLLRTLSTHGGLSEAEGYSLMRLPSHGASTEALQASSDQFAAEFRVLARELLRQKLAQHVLVLAPEPFGEYFARTLADAELEDIFTDGGTVRAVSSAHITPHIALHATRPDLSITLATLFADQQ